MNSLRTMTLTSLTLGLIAFSPLANAQASARPALPTTLVASYQMNEAPGSTVLVDASGHGYNGVIGSEVGLSGTYHSFPVVTDEFTRDRHRLDIVDSSALNPGSGDFSVTLRLRWTVLDGDINVIQKGQGNVAGGRWHISTPKGHIKCVFSGAQGGSEVDSWGQPTLAGTGWHRVTCARTSAGMSLVIDRKTVEVATKKTGYIANTTPMSIGGKLNCKCDYWTGDIDWVVVKTG